MAWKFQAARPSHSIQGRPVQGSSDSLSLVRALSILVWTSRMLRYNEIVLSCSGADKIGALSATHVEPVVMLGGALNSQECNDSTLTLSPVSQSRPNKSSISERRVNSATSGNGPDCNSCRHASMANNIDAIASMRIKAAKSHRRRHQTMLEVDLNLVTK